MSALQLLIEAVGDLHTTHFNEVSAAALVVYEIIVTLDQEIARIWWSQWTIVKTLYLIVRYYAMFFVLVNTIVNSSATFLSQSFCDNYNHFRVWGNVIMMPMVDCLIVIRIYALYGRSHKMGVALAALWLSQIIIGFTLPGLAWRPFQSPIQNPLPGILTGCITKFTPRYSLTIACWGAVSAFQAIYVILTLFKLVEFVQTFGFSKSAFTPVLKVFFRDGAAHFVIILATALLNTFIEKFGSIPLSEAAALWSVAIPSIAACRLVLNIRDITAPSEILTGSHPEMMLSTDTELHEMRFGTLTDADASVTVPEP